MNERIEKVLAILDGFRMSDEMTYSAYSTLHDEISLLDDLLKEQEARKPIYNEIKYGSHFPHCGNCEKLLPNNVVYGKVNFCHYCGQAVKWK